MSVRRRSQPRSRNRPGPDWLLVLVVIQLVVSFVLGGDTARNDLQVMLLELVSLPLLALTIWRCVQPGAPSYALPVLALLAGVLILPLLQLTPLPLSIWQALPGRALATDSLAIASAGGEWRPFSLTPEATWRAFLWLIPPAGLFLAMPHVKQHSRLTVMIAILAMTTLSLIVGALQLVGVQPLQFYAHGGDQSQAGGLFWNRNHQASTMAISLPLAAAVIVSWRGKSIERRKLALAMFVAVMGLFVVGALATLSRAGLVLSAVSLLGALVIFYQAEHRASGQRLQALAAIGTVALMVALIAVVGLSPVLARFDRAGEPEARLQYWPTIAATASGYFPAGTGLGAFDPVYRSVEPPQTINDTYVVAAHSDFLQIWLEGGAGGVILATAILMWLAARSIPIWRSRLAEDNAQSKGASLAIWILVAHSVADYPLRTQALACVFAVLCGVMAGEKRELAVSSRSKKKNFIT